MATRSLHVKLGGDLTDLTEKLGKAREKIKAVTDRLATVHIDGDDKGLAVAALRAQAMVKRLNERKAQVDFTERGFDKLMLDIAKADLAVDKLDRKTATIKVREKREGGLFSGGLGGLLEKGGSLLSLGSESLGGTSGGIGAIAVIGALAQGLVAASVAAGGLAAALAPVAGPIMTKISKEWGQFSKTISGTKAGKQAISAAAEAFHMLLVNLTPVVIQMLPSLTRLFKDIGQSATSGGLSQFLKWLAINGPKAFSAVAHATRLAGHAIHAMAPVIKLVEAIFGAFFKIISAGFDLIGGIIDVFTGNWKGAGHEFRKVADNIGSAFSGLWHAIERIGKDIFGWFGSLGGKILHYLGDVGSLLYNAGKKIVQGLINGIKSMFGSLGSAMGGLMSKLRGFLPFSPAREGPLSGSGSPQIAGAKIAQMLARGIGTGIPGVGRAAGSMAAAVAGGYASGVRHAGAHGGQPIQVVMEFHGKGGDNLEREIFQAMAHQMRVRGGDSRVLTMKPRNPLFMSL